MRLSHAIGASIGSSLKLKLVLFIVAILSLTVGIAPWSAIKMQKRQLLRVSEERLRTLHQMLQETIIDTCMLTGDPESVQKVLEAVSHHRDIEGVRLFDTQGVIRYSSHREERGRRLSRAELTRYYGHADPLLIPDASGGVSQTLVRPVFNQPACLSCHQAQQKVLGIIQVSVSLDSIWQQLASLKRSAILATLITLGVVVVGIWLALTMLIDQPLQQMIGVMGRAEHGDLSARVETRNSDELGRLARHFNEMIAKLDGAQEEIQRYHQEQLARADRLATIGEMAAAIAHEIRNPLTGISGALTVLSRDYPENDPRREIVREIHLLINRLNKSVEEILHYTRPSRPQLQPVKLDDIIDRTLSLVEGEAKKTRIRLLRETAPGIDDGGASSLVSADPHQIQQVLMNLILNAIQATAAGGHIDIRTRTKDQDGQPYACVQIEDNGKGMTAEEAEKAFHPFFSTKAQGTGLGLPIAKQIIEQHQGRISLRSTPGQGTRVEVQLPIHAAAPLQSV